MTLRMTTYRDSTEDISDLADAKLSEQKMRDISPTSPTQPWRPPGRTVLQLIINQYSILSDLSVNIATELLQHNKILLYILHSTLLSAQCLTRFSIFPSRNFSLLRLGNTAFAPSIMHRENCHEIAIFFDFKANIFTKK